MKAVADSRRFHAGASVPVVTGPHPPAASKRPAATKVSSAPIAVATRTALTPVVRRTPESTRAVTAPATPTATGTVSASSAPSNASPYPANPSAAVDADAVLATRNSTPAEYPSHGLSRRYPYS